MFEWWNDRTKEQISYISRNVRENWKNIFLLVFYLLEWKDLKINY